MFPRCAVLFGDDDLAGGGNDGSLESPFYGHREIIVGSRKRCRTKRLVAAPADQNRTYRRFVCSDDERAAGGSVSGLAIKRKLPCSFRAGRQLIVQKAFFHRQPAPIAPVDVPARNKLNRQVRSRLIGETIGRDPFDWMGQTRDGPIMNHRDRDRIGASSSVRAEIDRHPRLLAVIFYRKEARLRARSALFVEKYMGSGRYEVVGERELAGAMRIAAFDEAGARKTGAKLGRVELLLGRESLHAAAAVLAEHDNRHDFERRSLRQHMRGERNSGSLNGNSKKDDANGGSVHSTLLKHLVFSCRIGAAPA